MAAYEVVQQRHLVTLGIKASFPSTGFGYIERGELLTVYRVEAFREKPDATTAEQFIANGRHTGNSSMFIWHVDRIVAEM